MSNEVKIDFLETASLKLDKLERFGNSLSLFQIQGSDIRLYLRYSKIHSRNQAFYGLRDVDLKQLEGFPSFICFLWEGQDQPLLIPYADFEEVFQSATLANDGQYKVSLFLQEEALELYIGRIGRFNVEGYFGWDQIESLAKSTEKTPIPNLSHSQIQTLLGAIGVAKKFDVWIPPNDRTKLDWSIAREFTQREILPIEFEKVSHILSEIDVVWLQNKNPQVAVEIHYGGNLGDALDRLRHARDFNFRKIIIVIINVDDHRRALDILKFDEKLKHVIDLWSLESIYYMYSTCVAFNRLYSKFDE